ncbi:flavodoxin [bacterium 1xD42-67]|nr:flavodoxin [bacterium 1xD42-67]
MKISIVYYSHSGNTRCLAEMIAAQTGGDLLEILPETPYPQAYSTVVEQAKRELKEGFRPALRTEVPDLAGYDAVLIGTPNWWSSPAPPVSAFLEGWDLTGKRAASFCTHGGGGAGHIQRDIERLCRSGEVLPGLAVYESSCGEGEVRRWLERIGMV